MASRNTRVFAILNPARKHHRQIRQLIQDHCAALGFPAPEVLTTTIEEPGQLQAKSALKSGADLVIVAGGDGTVRNVGSVLAHSGVSMGIIPTGTANIFHLNAIGKQKRLDQSVRTALMGTDTEVDSGTVRLTLADGSEINDRFLVVVGVGRDALSLGAVSDRIKKITGPGAYFASGLPQLMRKPIPMTVEIDGELTEHTSAWSVLVGNCGVVPGKITIMPGASLIDGKLNVLHVAPKSIFGWIPVAWRGLRGSDRTVSGLFDGLTSQVTILPEDAVSVQIDGDVIAEVRRIDVSVDPASLVIRGRELPPNDFTAESERDPQEPLGLGEPT